MVYILYTRRSFALLFSARLPLTLLAPAVLAVSIIMLSQVALAHEATEDVGQKCFSVQRAQYNDRAGTGAQMIREYTVDGVSYTAVYKTQQTLDNGNYLYVDFTDSRGVKMRYEGAEKRHPSWIAGGADFLDLHLAPVSSVSSRANSDRQLAAVSHNADGGTLQKSFLRLAQENRVGDGASIPVLSQVSRVVLRDQLTLKSEINKVKTRDVHLAIGEAAQYLRPEALSFLLKSQQATAYGRANPDVIAFHSHHQPLPPLEGDTPLHRALAAEHSFHERAPSRLRVVEILLDNGANPNAISRSSRTPLDQVLSSSRLPNNHRVDLVKKLLEHGADPNYRSERSWAWTPPLLQVLEDKRFSASEKKELLSMLLARGADPKRRVCNNGKEGLSALEFAQSRASDVGADFLPLLVNFSPPSTSNVNNGQLVMPEPSALSPSPQH